MSIIKPARRRGAGEPRVTVKASITFEAYLGGTDRVRFKAGEVYPRPLDRADVEIYLADGRLTLEGEQQDGGRAREAAVEILAGSAEIIQATGDDGEILDAHNTLAKAVDGEDMAQIEEASARLKGILEGIDAAKETPELKRNGPSLPEKVAAALEGGATAETLAKSASLADLKAALKALGGKIRPMDGKAATAAKILEIRRA